MFHLLVQFDNLCLMSSRTRKNGTNLEKWIRTEMKTSSLLYRSLTWIPLFNSKHVAYLFDRNGVSTERV